MVLAQQEQAWNRGDLEGYMQGYWKSPDLMFYSGGTVTRGWEATLERYRRRYKAEGKEMGRLDFTEDTIEMLGADSAVGRGRCNAATRTRHPPMVRDRVHLHCDRRLRACRRHIRE